MKVVAHPLIVAVALGLLGPTALENEDMTPDERPGIEPLANPNVLSSPLNAEAPSQEDFERVQLEWQEARTWI